MPDTRPAPSGFLELSEFWAQLSDRLTTSPTPAQRFMDQVWAGSLLRDLRRLEDDDIELDLIARRKHLRLLVPVGRLRLQAENHRFSRAMPYTFFDCGGESVAEIIGPSAAFVWLHTQAETLVLDRHLGRRVDLRREARRL